MPPVPFSIDLFRNGYFRKIGIKISNVPAYPMFTFIFSANTRPSIFPLQN